MACGSWLIWTFFLAGGMAGAGAATAVCMIVLGRQIRQRDETIDNLLWSQQSYEAVMGREIDET
jgi:hypothetical protein